MIKIALADDHAILRKGVASIISNFEGMSVVMEAGNGKELIDQLETAKELEVAINEVVKYGYYHTDIVNSRLLKKVANPSDADKYDLTEKELNFIKLACSEMTYKEIAEQLNLSPRTIDGYREQIFMKLGIKSRTGLVVFAIRAGLVLV